MIYFDNWFKVYGPRWPPPSSQHPPSLLSLQRVPNCDLEHAWFYRNDPGKCYSFARNRLREPICKQKEVSMGIYWIRFPKVFCLALFRVWCLDGAPQTKLQVTCTCNTSVGCGMTLHLPMGGFSYSNWHCITFLTSTQNKAVRIKQWSLSLMDSQETLPLASQINPCKDLSSISVINVSICCLVCGKDWSS